MKIVFGASYQSTQTYGNIGDRKVDGVLTQNNHHAAFAIYAPEIIKLEKVINKLQSDYDGFIEARDTWKDIDTWVFVFKSERLGVPSDVISEIASLDGIDGISTYLFTLEDIELLLDNRKRPHISFETLNSTYSIVTQLKRGYLDIREEFIEHDRNISLFYTGAECINIENRYNKMVSMLNLNIELNNILLDNLLMWNEMGIDEDIQRLINIRFPFHEDTITYMPIYDGYLSSGDDKLHEERIYLCDAILSRIKIEFSEEADNPL